MLALLVFSLISSRPFIMEAYEDSVLRALRHNEMRTPKVDSSGEGIFFNLRINSDTTQLQNEEQIWLNPINPANAVAVWRDFRLGYRRVGVAYSFNWGNDWNDALFEGTPYYRDSDPALTVDRNGVFYAVMISFEAIDDSNALVLFRSADGGISWEGPYMAVGPSYDNFEDKELITCDRTEGPYSGNLYISWTRFWEDNIYLVRSEDGGVSWSAPILVSDAAGTQWSVPVVGVDGSVHVFWLDYNVSAIFQDVSYDGGSTFGVDVPVQYVDSPDRELNGNIWVFSYPACAVDLFPSSPFYGTIYIGYMDIGPEGDPDIFLTRSMDQGATWTDPLRVNDDSLGNGRDQFHPWIAVDSTGTLSIIFYDRRLDPSNWYFDLFLAQSLDGGQSFLPNQRMTSVSSDPGDAMIRAGLIGEYIGLDSYDGTPFAVWTDTREGSQDVYFALHESLEVRERDGTLALGKMEVSTLVKEPFFSLRVPTPRTIGLSLFDLSGRRIFHQGGVRISSGTNLIKLPEIKAGLYLLQISDKQAKGNFKLLMLR